MRFRPWTTSGTDLIRARAHARILSSWAGFGAGPLVDSRFDLVLNAAHRVRQSREFLSCSHLDLACFEQREVRGLQAKKVRDEDTVLDSKTSVEPETHPLLGRFKPNQTSLR